MVSLRTSLFMNFKWLVLETCSLVLFFQDHNINFIQSQVKCSVRGDLSPACNSAGMIDRHILGVDHLYAKPVYRNLKVSYFIRLYAVNLRFMLFYSFLCMLLSSLNVGMQYIQQRSSPTIFTLMVPYSFWSWRYFEVGM